MTKALALFGEQQEYLVQIWLDWNIAEELLT